MAITESLRGAGRDALTRLRGERDESIDLPLTGNDTDGWRLEWGYRNTGGTGEITIMNQRSSY